MQNSSMTALVSAFSRAWHAQNKQVKIFDDSFARRLLSDEEYAGIAQQMAQGIGFFCPGFSGDADAALQWIVDQQLSPSPLGRAAYAEAALKAAVAHGARQYLILGAGLDSFALRQPEWAGALEIFEIDHPLTAADKRRRLKASGATIPKNLHFAAADFADPDWAHALTALPEFEPGAPGFVSALGLSYYLPRAALARLFAETAALVAPGSGLVLDYPDQDSFTDRAGARAKKQALLAGGAKEAMRGGYSMREAEALLADAGFAVREQLTPDAITDRLFAEYNRANPDAQMRAFDNVNYALAERI